jgi:hypothetical protein
MFASLLCSTLASAAPPITQVMVVGVSHMSNPAHDLHDMKADDVLSPKRQGEIQAVTSALARFKPTKIAVEWDAPVVAERYPKYLTGNLPESRNEVVQLGFRLGKLRGGIPVYGIDADADMPYEKLINYSKAHDKIWSDIDASVQRSVATEQGLLANGTISAYLRHLNSNARLKLDNSWYRDVLKIGSGSEQPGVDLLSAWYRRNFAICANLVQVAKPGDRIIVFYGSGHAYQLRQCVSEMKGFALVDPETYLPK